MCITDRPGAGPAHKSITDLKAGVPDEVTNGQVKPSEKDFRWGEYKLDDRISTWDEYQEIESHTTGRPEWLGSLKASAKDWPVYTSPSPPD